MRYTILNLVNRPLFTYWVFFRCWNTLYLHKIFSIIIPELKVKHLQNVCDTFEFLKSESVVKSKNSKTVKKSYDFVRVYPSDENSKIVKFCHEIIINIETIEDLAVLIEQNVFSTSFLEVSGVCKFFETVTVATVDKSFSKSKLLKNYLRNLIVQERK